MRTLEHDYEVMVSQLTKDPQAILAQLTMERVAAWHAATVVCTEAGELLDAIKKVCTYNRPLDRENLVEELGDIEFGLEMIRQVTGVARQETLKHNMDKLAVRYEGLAYSDAAASTRADKP